MLRPALLLTLSLALPALAGEPRTSRSRVSVSGVYSVRLLEHAPGKCTLEVSKESGPVWKLDECVGGVDDVYFVSDDGQRVWALFPLVEKGTRSPGKRLPAWSNAVGAVQVDRHGQRLQQRKLLDFLQPRELPEVRQLQKHLKWMEGLLGVPGKGPRLTDAGRVEFETVGGRSHQLTF